MGRGHAPGDGEQVECPLAETHDVGGFVGEHVARVFVPLQLAGDRSRGPVGYPAAVGVEQAAEEQFGVIGNDLPLPVGERDRTAVFRAWAVLRKQTWPVLPVRNNRGVSNRLHPMHGAARVNSSYDGLGLVDQPRIDVVAGDPQRVDVPPVPRQAAVAQVQPQQMRVRRIVERPTPTPRALTRPRRTLPAIPPVTQRRPTDPEPLADRVQTLPGRDRRQCDRPCPLVVHDPSLPETADRFRCPGWDSNPHCTGFESAFSANWNTRAGFARIVAYSDGGS